MFADQADMVAARMRAPMVIIATCLGLAGTLAYADETVGNSRIRRFMLPSQYRLDY